MSADYWPIGNTPLVSGVQPPGFTSVTEEVLAEIVHRIVGYPRKAGHLRTSTTERHALMAFPRLGHVIDMR